MKFLKALVFSFTLLVLVMTAVPTFADKPGTNEDPFGGFPLVAIIGKPICRNCENSDEYFTGQSMVVPGGTPSRNSGDGSSPRKAINIGGIWAGNPAEPTELANCATVKIPAGNARWFKLEAYGDRRTQIWLDDELNSATSPSGSSVYGAANMYMWGTAPGDEWQRYALDGSMTDNFLEGFVLAVFDPDNLRPMGAFAPPNAAILTLGVDNRGRLLLGPDGISLKDATGAGIHGYATHNDYQPAHLLWYEGRFNGWVFVSAYNQMIWDGVASVCSQRVR